jgi:phosphoglycolate phosphatase
VATDVLVHFELASWFTFVGGATLDGSRRTKADVIEHTLAAIDRTSAADRAGTVLVGDREHDIEGARAAGISSIGVRWGFADPGELEAAGADAIADGVADLRSLLLSED